MATHQLLPSIQTLVLFLILTGSNGYRINVDILTGPVSIYLAIMDLIYWSVSFI